MDLELYLSIEVKKYENVGDFVYFNFQNQKLMDAIINRAKRDFSKLLNKRKIQKSYVIHLALIYIQMKEYSNSFWEPVRDYLNIYDKSRLSNQLVDAHLRQLIDFTHRENIEEINRQSIKVQFDGGISFPHLSPLYEICYDYYYKDLRCGLTETDFLEEAQFLLDGLKHKFQTEEFGEDEISINSTVYRVIKATRLRTLYTNDLMLDLLREILRMIDAYFWESIEYNGNHFIIEHFLEWAGRFISAKKKKLNIKSFINKENTEHIVRKPNLFFHSNEIYFKVPDQKYKTIDEFQKTTLQFNYDGLSKEFEPSIRRQMIGYLLTGSKVVITNPFRQFGYKILCGSDVIYKNDLDICNYYLFNEKTGSRLNTLKNYTGRIILITKPSANLFLKNCKVLTSLIKSEYKITQIDIKVDSVLSIEGNILSSYLENESGILLDKIEHFRYIKGTEEYLMTNTKPLIIIPNDYSTCRLLLRVNGKNYNYLNETIFAESSVLYDFNELDFKKGIYHVEVIEICNNEKLYDEKFYYDKNISICLDKDFYFPDEIAKATLWYNCSTFVKNIDYETNKEVCFTELDIKLRVLVPYIIWEIKDYDSKGNEVFLENLPSRCILRTKNISDIFIQNLEIPSMKIGEFIEFDFSGVHNLDKNEVSVRGNSTRGNVFLFKIYLHDFIDDTKTIINYDDCSSFFEGHVEYIGQSKLYIVISDDLKKVKKEVVDANFQVDFEILNRAMISFVKIENDEFGLFEGEEVILYTKEFKFFKPQNLINQVLLSETRITKKKKQGYVYTSKFNVRIDKHLGNNVYCGVAFFDLGSNGPVILPKFSPVRIEFMTNNLETSDNNFKIYFQDGEEIFSDWNWTLK